MDYEEQYNEEQVEGQGEEQGGFNLDDPVVQESFNLLPESWRKTTFDKEGFLEIAKDIGLTEEQTRKLWGAYTSKMFKATDEAYYEVQRKETERKVAEAERQQQEEEAREQEQSLETLQPDKKLLHDQLVYEVNRIMTDPNGPYLDIHNKHTPMERERTTAWVLDATIAINKLERGEDATMQGWPSKYEADQLQRKKEIYGPGYGEDKHSRSGERSPENPTSPGPDSIGFGEKEVKTSFGHRIEDTLDKDPSE